MAYYNQISENLWQRENLKSRQRKKKDMLCKENKDNNLNRLLNKKQQARRQGSDIFKLHKTPCILEFYSK